VTKKSVVRPKSNPKAAPAAAEDQTLAQRLMNHLNGCADDVFEHNIRFLSMRQEGNAFTGMLENQTLKTGPSSFTFRWTKPLKTEAEISALTMHIINSVADDYGDSDDEDE
jgi:hypothetical protein